MTITIPTWFAYALVGLWTLNNIVTMCEAILRWKAARLKRAITKAKIKREIQDAFESRHPDLVIRNAK